MAAYISVLILMAVGATVAGVVLVLTSLCGRHFPNKKKMSVYECGVPPIGDARRRVSVKFYLVAILFLLFDVEGVFFYPWAVVFKKFLAVNNFILFEMLFSLQSCSSDMFISFAKAHWSGIKSDFLEVLNGKRWIA